MTIEEMELIRLALDTPEHNKYYVKHTTEAKMILNKHEKAINYSQCCTQLPTLLENTNRVEVIDQQGRTYVNWKPNNKVKLSLQDNKKTLKVFIND